MAAWLMCRRKRTRLLHKETKLQPEFMCEQHSLPEILGGHRSSIKLHAPRNYGLNIHAHERGSSCRMNSARHCYKSSLQSLQIIFTSNCYRKLRKLHNVGCKRKSLLWSGSGSSVWTSRPRHKWTWSGLGTSSASFLASRWKQNLLLAVKGTVHAILTHGLSLWL